jgi:hypothetical protein
LPARFHPATTAAQAEEAFCRLALLLRLMPLLGGACPWPGAVALALQVWQGGGPACCGSYPLKPHMLLVNHAAGLVATSEHAAGCLVCAVLQNLLCLMPLFLCRSGVGSSLAGLRRWPCNEHEHLLAMHEHLY